MSSGSLLSQLCYVDEDSASCVVVQNCPTATIIGSEDRTNDSDAAVVLPPPRTTSLQRSPSADNNNDAEGDDEVEEEVSYQEHPRFRTWKKHVNHFYQTMMHVDLVWESPPVQLMPFMTIKDHLATQTVLCGTRTGGQEQNYLQFLNITTPADATSLDDNLSDESGEVGGYGRAPSGCGMRVERRMFHDGDVLAARYMHANPLLLATASSNHNLYVFDWSRVSLTMRPNKVERPRGPLPPNELSQHATDEERHAFHKRMKQVDDAATQQQAWDRETGPGQHVLTLVGHTDTTSHVDWNTSLDGLLASGSRDTLRVWQIGNHSKTADRTVEPFWSVSLDDETAEISDSRFSWQDPHTLIAGCTNGTLFHADVRSDVRDVTELLQLPSGDGITSVSLSPLQGNLIALGTSAGTAAIFDLRSAAEPVVTQQVHTGDVTCIQWCPHREHVLATGGDDGVVVVQRVDTEGGSVLFKHFAHTDTITDMGWGWQDGFEYEMVSVDQNAITMWRPRNQFLKMN